MNEKLKTVDDIEGDSYYSCTCDGDYTEGCTRCLRRKLKTLAIKLWKDNNSGDDMCCTCEEMWREFFNITEDDLQ